MTLEEWSLAWSCSDQSTNSPLQGNNNDCGIVSLVILALLSNGTILRPESYSQYMVNLRQTCQRITYLIWLSGLEDLNTKETAANHSNDGIKERPEEEEGAAHAPRQSESVTNAHIGKIH